MESKILFGRWEASSILIIIMTTQLFLGFPRFMAQSAGTAGWILCIYAAILALLLFLLISKLYSRFEGKDIIDLAEMVGGSIGRAIVGMVLVINYVFILSIVLRQFGEDLKIIALTQSPISFVILFFLVGMAVAAYFGIEPIVRLGAILIPIVAIGFFIIIISASEHFKITNILPILGTGPNEIFVKGIPKISIFSGLSVLFLMVPFIGSNGNLKRVGIVSILISAFFLTLGTLAYLIVFPYPTAVEGVLPVYQLSRLIYFGRFFQRIESLFVLVWTGAALIYLSIVLFFIIYVLKKAFKLKYERPLIAPAAVIIFTLSLLPKSLMSTVELEARVFRVFAWIVTFALPAVLLLIATLLKRKKEGGVKS
ncbi:MAG: GerAB/ArcD/ProY family transporter [Bacillota bacterium]